MLGKKKKESTGTEIVQRVQTGQREGTKASAKKRADELAALAKRLGRKPEPPKTKK